MSHRKTAVLRLLNETRTSLLTALTAMDEAAWETAVYASEDSAVDGRWTASDVLRHLLSAEKGMTGLMQKILLTGEGVPADFDRDRYNRRQVEKIKTTSPADLLLEMSHNRQALLAFIDQLQETDWDKNGRHASLKIMSIEEICQTIANHELAHLNEIKQLA